MSLSSPNSIKNFMARPLTSSLGAEIEGVDLATELSDVIFNKIYEALLRYQVLVFRDHDFPPERQLEFGQRFGEVQVHVLNQFHDHQYPELYILTNLDKEGKPDGKHPDPGSLYWHTDGSWTQRRTLATMLYSLEAPLQGGETQLADMYGAYEALTDEMKMCIGSLRAIHHLNFHKKRRDPVPLTAEQVRKTPPVEHDIVRIHSETGRPTVYLGDMAESIVGIEYDQSRLWIEELNELITRPEFIYTHKWRSRELVIWDNRCTLHRSMPYNTSAERRVMRRLTVLDREPE